MNAHTLKYIMTSIALIVATIFGAIGIIACGTVGAFCQSEHAAQFQSFSFTIFIISFLFFLILLFLPHRFFGITENS